MPFSDPYRLACCRPLLVAFGEVFRWHSTSLWEALVAKLEKPSRGRQGDTPRGLSRRPPPSEIPRGAVSVRQLWPARPLPLSPAEIQGWIFAFSPGDKEAASL